MHHYLNALRNIRLHGKDRTDRTGTGTRSLFGEVNMEFALTDAEGRMRVPLLTTKKVNFEAIKRELKWMLDGETNIRSLQKHGVKIWDEWATPSGELGPVYGHQWRNWPDTRVVIESDWLRNQDEYEARGFRAIDRVSIDVDCTGVAIHRNVDQIADIEKQLRTKPDSRRIILSGWNASAIEEMALPPCHTLAQWYVRDIGSEKPVLDCKLYQRSGDFFLGVPFNIVQYSLFTHKLAHANGMQGGRFYHTSGDAHIYHNHFDQVDEQLSRIVDETQFPHITIAGEASSVLDIEPEQILLHDYNPQAFIRGQVAV